MSAESGDPTSERSLASRILNPHGFSPRGIVLRLMLCLALSIFIVDRLAHAMFWPDEDSTEVVLVSSSACPYSRAAKAHLDGMGVPYREIESRSDPLRAALAGWAFQSMSVPIVVVGSDIVHGYREGKIDDALVGNGYSVASREPAEGH